MTKQFINIQSLYKLIDVEPFILLGCLIAMVWIFYKFFLGESSAERHRSIRAHFSLLLRHFIFLTFLFVLFVFMRKSSDQLGLFNIITPYLAVVTFVWGNIVLVKACRLLVLQYLFLGSMKHGVPILLVNIFSLLISIVLVFWGISVLFGIEVGPLLATSAAFSVILGFAMQDTLGNLFAGISLQLDRSFEIGDWLEVTSGIQKLTGQVKEITWRSTTLQGFSDELITLPNRFIANAQISNFSPPDQPIVRRQIFRLAYGENVALAKQVLERAVTGIGDIRGIPAPAAYVSDSTENWIELKVIYFIDNYGSQYGIADKVHTRCIEALFQADIKLARQILQVAPSSEATAWPSEPQGASQ